MKLAHLSGLSPSDAMDPFLTQGISNLLKFWENFLMSKLCGSLGLNVCTVVDNGILGIRIGLLS